LFDTGAAFVNVTLAEEKLTALIDKNRICGKDTATAKGVFSSSTCNPMPIKID